MAKPYSNDLRARVIEAIEEGATREETAERHHVSLSSVGRFLRLKREHGSVSPAKFGGYKPYALAAHEELVRQLLAEQPDITLAELKALPEEAESRGWANIDLPISASSEVDL
jgi:transposase